MSYVSVSLYVRTFYFKSYVRARLHALHICICICICVFFSPKSHDDAHVLRKILDHRQSWNIDHFKILCKKLIWITWFRIVEKNVAQIQISWKVTLIFLNRFFLQPKLRNYFFFNQSFCSSLICNQFFWIVDDFHRQFRKVYKNISTIQKQFTN